jgi:type I restriction enzyme S subunit
LGEGALERFKSGAATKSRDRLTPRGLLDLRVPLPPLEEQRRIVDVLNRAAGIRRLREAALAKARDTIPALFLSMFGEPATNPMGWPFKSVADCGRVQLGRQRTPKYQTGKWSKPYMRVANVFEDRIDLSDVLEMDFDDRDHATYRLHVGDILLNEGQSLELVGRPAMWRGELADCCFQNTLVRFQATDSIVNPDFALAHFLWFFRAGAFSRIASKTSNVAHLGAGRFAAMEMFVPPLPLQQEFAARLGDLRGIIAQAERALTLARDTERALMAQLLG